jgi:hypothetical protein
MTEQGNREWGEEGAHLHSTGASAMAAAQTTPDYSEMFIQESSCVFYSL